jgi:predicted amidohydrolase YtcJ
VKKIAIPFVLLCSSFLLSCGGKNKADLIVYNGVVYTVDSAFSKSEAFAVKDGVIVEVGSNNSIRSRYDATEEKDAHGMPVYPGFIDAHAHFVGYGRSLYQVGLYDCKSWEEVLERVNAFVKDHPDEPWILGRGWDQNVFPGKQYPTNKELSELFPGKPLLLQRVDGHAAIANAMALELAGVTGETKLAGGKVELDKGIPTGLLIDNAVDLVSSIVPKANKKEYEKWLTTAQRNCFAQGLTMVADCGLTYYDVTILDTLQREGKLDMRMYVMLSDDTVTYKTYMAEREKVLAGTDAKAKKKYPGDGPYKTDRLFVKGVKAYADGALGSRGACLKKPYTDKPEWTGFLLSSQAHFDSLAAMLINTDMQLCTHAIGDSGNRVVLNIYAKYLTGVNDKRWRIEHAQVVDSADFYLFGKYAIVPSVQPTHATSDMYWAEDRLGHSRMKGAYAYQLLLNQNGWMPLGTDFPVEDISAIKTFYAAVVRKDNKGIPEGGFQNDNALTREQALKGMTIWAAKSCFMEKEVGSLEVGKKADFVILDKDLMKADEKELLNVKVNSTYLNGKNMK